jgi:hypothetical protein
LLAARQQQDNSKKFEMQAQTMQSAFHVHKLRLKAGATYRAIRERISEA